MSSLEYLITRDKQHIWHPATQMKDLEKYPPLIIEKAQGGYLYTNKGPIIDAISSWWCKSLGHGHPAIIAAIQQQLVRFEHVIAAGTTNSQIVELSELLTLITGKQHSFFASDGACAVEIAMKLALQANQIKGKGDKQEFIALKNAYHGETLGTLSVSDMGIYKKPFESYGVKCHFMDNIPYVSGKEDPLWSSCDAFWPAIENKLNAVAEKVCAVIIEPIVQGAAGMHCYSADFLKKLADWAKSKDIFLIADEIMTGVGRTGKWLACQHSKVDADLICLSKGLTSGSLPLSCVMIDKSIYDLFYANADAGRSFLHSHTYSGNPLAVSAALATIKTILQEDILSKVESLHEIMLWHFEAIAKNTGFLRNVRSVGAIVAADLVDNGNHRMSLQLYQEALNRGALLRPISNTVYWLPPLNTDEMVIAQLADITQRAIEAIY